MAETAHALGQILLQALPTFFLVIFLYIYLNQMYFKPFGKVIAERRALFQREQQPIPSTEVSPLERTSIVPNS